MMGAAVRFRLVTADTAKDNRKDNDKERRFVLIEPHTRTIMDDEGDEYEEELLPVEEMNGANGKNLSCALNTRPCLKAASRMHWYSTR